MYTLDTDSFLRISTMNQKFYPDWFGLEKYYNCEDFYKTLHGSNRKDRRLRKSHR